ncbi:hypothetical protein [Metabacillus sp. RGM 3146]|uniref:hypothetical protein n=1 Tax=Metabacillus sp. RGM 3146 TaxID=3401092 RepID=UPI003B99FFF6
MKLKHIATLSTALILLFAAGCQSQSTSESSAKKESVQAQSQESLQKKDEPKQQEQAPASTADQNKDQKQAQSSNDSASGKSGDTAKKDNQTTADDTKKDDSASQNTDSSKTNNAPYMSPFELREELQIGMSKKEVDDILQNSEPVGVKDGSNATEFRYDYMPQPGYKTTEKEVDIEGLKADKLDAQILVKWNKDQKLEMFTIYHKNDDGKILKYKADANQQEEMTVEQ